MEQNGNNTINVLPRSDDDLPQDILEEITSRLPAKSILRLKSVCRLWFNIISDLDLPQVSFHQSIKKIRIVYQTMDARSDDDPYSYSSFKLDEEGIKAKKVATLRLQDASAEYPDELACDHLLLFRGKTWSKLYVYDTITQQQKLLPELSEEGASCYSMVYDASKRIYKVIVFVYQIGGMNLFLYDLDLQKWCRTGKWRKSEPPLPQLIHQKSSIVLQGVLYWIAQAAERDGVSLENCFVQPMDISTEKFMERIESPCQRDEPPSHCDLLEMKGSLCFLDVGYRYGDEIKIWALNKDSDAKSCWIKRYNIALSSLKLSKQPNVSGYGYLHDFQPRLFVENYMLLTIRRTLYWYNLDTMELKEITLESDSHCYPCTFSIIN